MTATDLNLLSAEALIGHFLSGELSPVDVVEQRLALADAPLALQQRALTEARAAQAHYRKGETLHAPLLGVPFSANGVNIEALGVQRLRRAGGILLTDFGTLALSEGIAKAAVAVTPTLGSVPQVDGLELFNRLNRLSLLSHSAQDAALALDNVVGADPRDPWSLRISPPQWRLALQHDPELHRLRIGWAPGLLTQHAAHQLQDLGASIEERSLDLASEEAFATFARREPLSADRLQHANFQRTVLLRQVQTLFNEVDVWLTPTTCAQAFALTGHPSVTLGELQLVGPWYGEARLLHIARALA